MRNEAGQSEISTMKRLNYQGLIESPVRTFGAHGLIESPVCTFGVAVNADLPEASFELPDET
ncbi:MAG: hypothetical protein SFW09_11610 [Hyphomicrobiaceae bacterium]|nr:hypothetical protein [Hyphomicrobiaceae bacterium]